MKPKSNAITFHDIGLLRQRFVHNIKCKYNNIETFTLNMSDIMYT
jgi:hypothetical protein